MWGQALWNKSHNNVCFPAVGALPTADYLDQKLEALENKQDSGSRSRLDQPLL